MLTPAQQQALYQQIAGVQGGPFAGATPDMSQDERNQYINQYGSGGQNYGDYLDWYKTNAGTLASGSPYSATGAAYQPGGIFAGATPPPAAPSSLTMPGGSPGPSTGAQFQTGGQFAGASPTGAPSTGTTLAGITRPTGGTTPLMPATGARAPGTVPGTLAGGHGGTGTPPPYSTSTTPVTGGGAIAPINNSNNLPIDVNSFLDPNTGQMIKNNEALVQNSAAARGGLQSGNTLKELSNSDAGIMSDAYNKALSAAMADRNFNVGVNQDDRNFAYTTSAADRAYQTALDEYNQQFGYNAQVGDRTFNQNAGQFLTTTGLQATQQQSQLAALLATLTSNNAIGAGSVGAAGAGSNSAANTNLYNQIINAIISGGLLQNPTGTTPRP